MKKIFLEVLNDIRPSPEYKKNIISEASAILGKINKSSNDAKAVLGGSGAKGTWLKTFDVDIFVKFNYAKYKDNSQSISDLLQKILKKHFKFTRLHGSRDYFQIKKGKFTFEVIPILSIKKSSQAKNITDVSPLHSGYINKHRELVDEIRLTKQFFKAAKVYGAESYIKGFSGYVCEILTIYYGSFQKLIRAIPKWKKNNIIDIEGYHKGKNILMELNTSKLQSPLIVIDPVQKDRNAAAALDIEKFEIIKHRAKEFLKKPSKDYFEIKIITEEDLRKKFRDNFILLRALPIKNKTDVSGAKMLKAFHFIEDNLLRSGFDIKESDMLWHSTEGIFYYALKKDHIPEEIEIQGPPVKTRWHAQNFKKKHKKTFVKGGRIMAKANRKFPSAEKLIKELIESPNIKKNIRKIYLI
jgi:tRNA nucleotidyltransferase (CCA-adding enzyme)